MRIFLQTPSLRFLELSLSQALKIFDPIAENGLALARSGMSDENREELLKKYQTPDNCLRLEGPALNPELKFTLAKHAQMGSFKLALQNQLECFGSSIFKSFETRREK